MVVNEQEKDEMRQDLEPGGETQEPEQKISTPKGKFVAQSAEFPLRISSKDQVKLTPKGGKNLTPTTARGVKKPMNL